MTLVFFTHPSFLEHQSMPRFANMLTSGLGSRGHSIEVWSPSSFFSRLPGPLKKWLGYIDQYILFPLEVKRRLRKQKEETLFVFTDNALGPWVPLVKDLHHVIHCHDFLAQRSALGMIPENPTSWTGQQYQAFIRSGYSKGKNFISVSNKTKTDLHYFLRTTPRHSEVVYNGFNQSITPTEQGLARKTFGNRINMNLSEGFILHVGGNAWYKNRKGVIEIYNAWRTGSRKNIPLLLVGEPPSEELKAIHSQSPFKSAIHWLSGIEDEFVRQAYSGATLFLFPSLAEGFGWPIAEAMAAGGLVVTTDEAPMNEVAGSAGFLIQRRPTDEALVAPWANAASKVISKIVDMSSEARTTAVNDGLANAKRFNTDVALDRIESIYQTIVSARQ